MLLRVQHVTTYLYSQPVSLGPHRLMMRPRESASLNLLSFSLATSPPSLFSWIQDVYGNTIAQATPLWASDRLLIECDLRVENLAEQAPMITPAATAQLYPFRHGDTEWGDLGQLVMPQYPDPGGELRSWAQAFVAGHPTDTLALLQDINCGISNWIFYQSRHSPGTQTPQETLRRGWGSCRDLAVLLADAVRWLGFGARLVSGYIYMPGFDQPVDVEKGFGSTHAWVDIYIPGAGWIAFDPTHGSHGGANLIPVAVARSIAQLPPVEGSFIGLQADYIGMSVGVSVTGGAMQQDGALRGQPGE